MQRSSIPTWLGLVGGSWFGLIWASLLFAPVGVGFGVAVSSALGGFVVVPLWGTFWGLALLAKQRDNALLDYGVTRVSEDAPLAQRVYRLAERLGLPARPWVGVMPHNNAYAIGSSPKCAMVVIGQPLLDILSDDEIDAIIGHELGHIANNDMRRMGLARSFQNSLVWYLSFSDTLKRAGRWILTWLSEVFILRLSRKREYWADAIGAALTSKEHMIGALEKLHNAPNLSSFERRHARLMVRGFSESLLSTHPTLDQRRNALLKESYIRRLPFLIPTHQLEAVSADDLVDVKDIAYAKQD